MVRDARLRLLDLWQDEENGINQHQLYEDLKSILQLLREGGDQFRSLTQGQGGHTLRHGATGLEQAVAAAQQAQAATTEGDTDWYAGSWGAAVGVLLEEAEQAIDEAMDANLVHCADVLALQHGGEEAPRRPQDRGGPP